MKLDIEEQLKRAIQESPENQRTIALGAGVNVGMLSRFLRGERSISLGTAAKLASYLGLSLKR
jgi:transcriptional regulator with XRE-family HTH domain